MYRLERHEFVQKPYTKIWTALGFQAGFINAIGFMACGKYVSHVTGFGTQTGVALAENRLWFALELAGFPGFFILGAFLSGIWTSVRIERGLPPHYRRVMLAIPIGLLLLMAAGESGILGPFGEQLIRTRDFLLLYSLSFICGMQNACFATLTKGQIRTTHLTGISTDIGTDLARLLYGKLGMTERTLTRAVNRCRILTFVGFTSGSILSVWTSNHFGYAALGIPFLISTAVFGLVLRIERRLNERFGVPSPSGNAAPAAAS